MKKKILFCASTTTHIKNFHLPYLKAFHESNYEVWVASNKNESIPYADKVIALPFRKSFINLQNIKAMIAVRKILRDESFTIVSTHTTLASAIVRTAILLLHKKCRPKVFNTSHGYLFHENDGLKKWVYLLPEKICAHVTDVLMVMNHEDYDIAQKHKLYKDRLYYINGMGIDLMRFTSVSQEERSNLRKKQGISEKDFLFVYAAEFSKRKNHRTLIRSFANVCKQLSNVWLILAGEGVMIEECKMLVNELHIEKRVCFLGYVKDIRNLYAICDASVSTSLIEGLPFNVMEAMACGLPVIASNIKGHRELIDDGVTGFLFNNKTELENQMVKIYSNIVLRKRIGYLSLQKVMQFGIDKVLAQIMEIYAV